MREELDRMRVITLAILTLLMLMVAACSPAQQETSEPEEPTEAAAEEPTEAAEEPTEAPEAAQMQEVTFVTDFGFNGRHAYYFVALDKGYYADEGLDVTIERGGGSADAIKQVAAGQADLGFADAATLVLARGNDQVPVKLVAVVYQKPPQGIYALEESGIQAPEDLEGKTLADTAGSAVPAMFPLYAQAAGIDEESVTWVVADSAALPGMLAAGQADGIGQFIVGEPLLERAVEGKELVRLAYGDVGLDYYGNGIIAGEEILESNPDLVRAFVRATIRGMQDAFADPEEAGQILNKYHPEVEPEIGAGETQAVADLANTSDTEENGLGYINPERIESTIEVVSSAFELQSDVSPDELYEAGFTSD